MLMKIDSPIIPYIGMGNITLYSTIDDLSEILSQDGVTFAVLNDSWIQYNVQNYIELYFHIKNKKLFRITTLDKYEGTLFNCIGVGTSVDEMLKTDSTFIYNEFEEVWESSQGVFVETDAETNKVRWISVYIKELNSEEFELANW